MRALPCSATCLASDSLELGSAITRATLASRMRAYSLASSAGDGGTPGVGSAAINATLTEKGLLIRSGTIVDATIINAPSSTKNAEHKRDDDMH